MNEFTERQNEFPNVTEFSQPPEHQDFSLDDLIREANTFVAETNDFINGLPSDTQEGFNVREHGVQECADATKRIFTPEVIKEWGEMDLAQRCEIIKAYSDEICEGLNISPRFIEFEKMPPGKLGYTNDSDCGVYLNEQLIKDPAQLIYLIDTVAHEMRHQFQFEAIRNPEKFGVDAATIKEWTVGLQNYSDQYATVYDPWGYHYNPVEIDARYFGETMVRELRKDLINNPQAIVSSGQNADVKQLNNVVAFSGSGWYESHTKEANKCYERATDPNLTPAERAREKRIGDSWAAKAADAKIKDEKKNVDETARKKGK